MSGGSGGGEKCLLKNLPEALIEQFIFSTLCSTLDFATGRSMALTCRRLGRVWRHYTLVVDLPHRLQRFYRGVALRHCVTILRGGGYELTDIAERHQNIELLRCPTTDIRSSDGECVAESIVFGLGADKAEFDALERFGVLSRRMRERLERVSRIVQCRPHTVPATRAMCLVPCGDSVIQEWKRSGLSITRVDKILSRQHKPIAWAPALAVDAEPLVHGERVRAHAAVLVECLGKGDDPHSIPLARQHSR
jgi:hypothetical protein